MHEHLRQRRMRLDLFLLWSRTKDASPDANDIAARRKGSLKVTRHTHTKQKSPMLVAPLSAVLREPGTRECTFEDVARRDEPPEVLVLLLFAQGLRQRSNRHEPLQMQAGAFRKDVLRDLDELGAVCLGVRRVARERGYSGLGVLS